MKLEQIYDDSCGKIKAGCDDLTGSIVLKVEYIDLNPESITFPNDAIDSVMAFLQKSKRSER